MQDVCGRSFRFLRSVVGGFIEVILIDTCLGLLVWVCTKMAQDAAAAAVRASISDSPGRKVAMSIDELEERLEKIEELLGVLVERQTIRVCYSTLEFSRIVGRAEFTVREWCRRGRILAAKKESGRGAFLAWVISHAELQRFQREGLLPVQRPA